MVISEDFRNAATSNAWLIPPIGTGATSNWACLSAGNNVGVASGNIAGSPPQCNKNYISLDQPGKGALILTYARNSGGGGIASNFTFPTNEGIEVTFVTRTYGTTSASGANGADGMSFFLADGDRPASIGGLGGGLGYACVGNSFNFSGANSGVDGGYLGIGIDEWGNFTNPRHGPGTGPGEIRNTIGVRGGGNMNIKYLQEKYGSTGITDAEIQKNYCRTGDIYRNRNPNIIIGKELHYQYLGHKTLSSQTPMVSSAWKTRDQAKPLTYKVKMTPAGILGVWLSYNGGAFQPIIQDMNIIEKNGYLPKSFRFGFAASTGGANNVHEVACFKAEPASTAQGSVSTGAPDSTYKTDMNVYTSYYNPLYLDGHLLAYNIRKDITTGSLVVNDYPEWDASCGLTGGACEALENTPNVSETSPNNRALWTYSGAAGTALEWSLLPTDVQNSLNGVNASNLSGDGHGEARLNFIRGVRTHEAPDALDFRKRKSVLGDIIDSSPAWVGSPSQIYDNAWQDKKHSGTQPETGQQLYSAFKAAHNQRMHMVYVGSNDGFLHGFRTGAYDASGQFSTEVHPNDGKEMMAFMPLSVLKRMHQASDTLDFSSTQYAHNFYHNASPSTGDVFYNGQWHTWLVSGLGEGGATIYALDITDPASFNQTTASANKHVIGEWSFKKDDPIWKHLGNTYGKPAIGRFHNGQWGAVFGNGWCTDTDAANGNCSIDGLSGEAGIYVMSIGSSGTPEFEFIGTGVGSSTDRNGIAYTTPVDIDDDNTIDFVYAGDIKGNLWRFNLNRQNTSGAKWADLKPQLLFKADTNQAITTKVANFYDEKTGKLMLVFGTGQRKPGYLDSADSYATGTQAIYGVWDQDIATIDADHQPTHATKALYSKAQLQQQTINTGTNQLSQYSVCWAGNANCVDTKAQYGWYMNLPTSGGEYEQLIYNPAIYKDTVVINTYINDSTSVASCDAAAPTGYSYPLKAETGSGIKDFFGKTTETATGAYRESLGAVGESSFLVSDGRTYTVTKNDKGQLILKEVFFDQEKRARRISWRIIV
ncbi:pilus assembly protein [Neisseria sp. Ec49-e6-T10]|uniref:pilus assembly protein n=1 Tax=Neisseria sp. Ec49-e6-T10 TaxID=3140744 RepID=UPI003EC09CEA